MKTNYIFIALTMLAVLTMVSCKNNKKAQNQEPTQEEVQEMKQALADSVLAEIDSIIDEYGIAYENGFRLRDFKLTEAEKLIKPDYLLEPSVANTLVTKSQKVNALAIYLMELSVRRIYEMPLDEAKEVIAKLAADVNHPIDTDILTSDAARSEKIRREYEICKEKGDVAYFWQFQNAIHLETSFLLAQNSELYFGQISDDQWKAFSKTKEIRYDAIDELAKYDNEMAIIKKFKDANVVCASREEAERLSNSVETAIQYHIANKDKYIARRNALLQ